MPTTVARAKESLENHAIIVVYCSAETRYRGMPSPLQYGLFAGRNVQHHKMINRRMNKLKHRCSNQRMKKSTLKWGTSQQQKTRQERTKTTVEKTVSNKQVSSTMTLVPSNQ